MVVLGGGLFLMSEVPLYSQDLDGILRIHGDLPDDLPDWNARRPKDHTHCASQMSVIRNCFLLGPYGRTMPRALRWS